MGLRHESPIFIHRSQFLSLLSLFMQSCSIHLLCSFIFPIDKPTSNCSLRSSAASGMDPQTQPVAARISELLAIREHLRDTGYRNVDQVAGGLVGRDDKAREIWCKSILEDPVIDFPTKP